MRRKLKSQMIECPRCHKRMTVTFLSDFDKKTCTCGRVIYAKKIEEINQKSPLETLIKEGLRGLFK